jgi:hypothetical protein
MAPVVHNAPIMINPIRVEEVSPEERIELLIEDVESDIYMHMNGKPLLSGLADPEVIHLSKRLEKLRKEKDKVLHAKKNRKRHERNNKINEVEE